MFCLNRSYSTRTFKPLENGNCYKNEYESSTYNSSNLNESFEINPNNKKVFPNNNLENQFGNFFNNMETFCRQRKELAEFKKQTDNDIFSMRLSYNFKKSNFKNNYNKRKKALISDYRNSLSFYESDEKAKEIEKKLDFEYNKFLNTIDEQNEQAISSYRTQRNYQYNQLEKKYKDLQLGNFV